MRNIGQFDHISMHIASPERVREWSYGEVSKPETINYRTLRPERDGLFCERIFGTTKEWECYCGKFKSIRYKGVICDRCGVEVSHFRVRRERSGHIELATPVSHIWFYKAVPSRIGLLLGMTISELRSILYYERFVVIDPGDTSLAYKDLLSEEEYREYRERHGESLVAEMGASAVKKLLTQMDISAEIESLRWTMDEKGDKTDIRVLRRLEILESFRHSKNRSESMIIEVLPVIPPELRPMVQLEGGRFATSDLNDLYRRVINRNNRLKRLLEIKAPEIIIRNEKRMLQEAVDALLDNARRKRIVKGPGNRPLKSLSDMIKGKQGRFRQNLLGKRVDYSGRSVIVSGPELKLWQCGLPRKMALELFKPFIMRKLVKRDFAYNIRVAKKMIEQDSPEMWGVLDDVVREHPVMLNRAPTLHRLGIQAFEPVLVEGKAILLHPLVCHAFNADFDGDQMAVHVPLSPASQIESWMLMLSAKNLLDPANGMPVVGPSEDIVLGIYTLTKERKDAVGEGKYVGSIHEVRHALEAGDVAINTRVRARVDGKWIQTTPGRMLLNDALPEGHPYVNEELDNRKSVRLIAKVIDDHGNAPAVKFLDHMKDLGFQTATKSGSTIGLDDIQIPEQKQEMLDRTDKRVARIQSNYEKGRITRDERYEEVTAAWHQCSERMADIMFDAIRKDRGGFNPVFVMTDSGARGSKQQIRQLAAMRGLMSKPSGEILDIPIRSNFKEGLSVLEYFISTHGARKGLADTALKTADAGYLTRRLVDVSQDVVVVEKDCGTINGVAIGAILDGNQEIESLPSRIAGRTALEEVRHPKTHDVIIKAGEEITNSEAEAVERAGLSRVRIRTVFTCESRYGICQKCYGRNLANNRTVEVGESVGIIAAQSIGQPGTQLTMRTFHIGGTAAKDTINPEIRLAFDALITSMPESLIEPDDDTTHTIAFRKGWIHVRRVLRQHARADVQELRVVDGDRVLEGDILGIGRDGEELRSTLVCDVVLTEQDVLLVGVDMRIPVRVGAKIMGNLGDVISANELLMSIDPYSEPILAEVGGTVSFEDMTLGLTLKRETDEETGTENIVVVDVRDGSMHPKIMVISKTGQTVPYPVPGGAALAVAEGEVIRPGDVLAKLPRARSKTRDITGGLPRVAELFEARKPKDAAVLAEQDGKIRFGERGKLKSIIYVDAEFVDLEGGTEVVSIKHLVPKGKHLIVREGESVVAGEPITDGLINPHDILRIQGDTKLQEYLINEVQEVYRRQGVNINDKHIGVIIRQMLRKVEITDVGDTDFIIGQAVDRLQFRDVNNNVVNEGGKPAAARPILLGITKASLNIESFISAASFQETTKVLTNAAIQGKIDYLRGLKENVIIGHRIPAGSGNRAYQDIRVVHKRRVMTEEEAKERADAAAAAEAAAAAAEEASPPPEESQSTTPVPTTA